MTPALRVALERLLPRALLGKTIYRIARSERPWVRGPLIRWVARTYRIDLADAEHADLGAYPTLNAFFTRGLRPDARPIEGDERTIVSPADGTLSEFGAIDGRQLFQAKGMSYRIETLLGESESNATALFENGAYLTVYLAPQNYHRVHVPLAATLTRTTYLPGERFSVNRHFASRIAELFCRNERAICWFDTFAGPMAVVLVGALNVATVSTVTLGEIESGVRREWREPRAVRFTRGAEIGRFNLGSTVVVLLPRGTLRWDARIAPGIPVRMGEALGRIVAEPRGDER
jgi:phosphatidylserine decarboxylase